MGLGSAFDKIGNKIDNVGDYTSDAYERNQNVLSKLEKGHKAPKSIAGAARSSIFEFPAFISSTVPLDYAEATCGLLELTYASWLQMCISRAPSINIKDSDDPFSLWKTDTHNYLECSNLVDTFDACHNVIKTEEGIMEFNLVSISDSTASVINEAMEYEPLSEFDHYFQEASGHDPEYYNPQYNKNKKEYYNAEKARNEAIESTEKNRANQRWAADTHHDQTLNPQYIKNSKDYYDMAELRRKHNVNKSIDNSELVDPEYAKAVKMNRELEDDEELRDDDENPIRSKDYYERLEAKNNLDHADRAWKMQNSKFFHDVHAKAPTILDESKIQKLNSLKPLTMSVEMNVRDERENSVFKGTSQTREFIVGIKIYSRIIKAETLPEVAKYPLEEMNKRTRHVRWKAGELKFFKDILFRIKQKKQTAVDAYDEDRKWYRRLYELAHSTGDSASVDKMTNGKSIVRKRLKHYLLHFGDDMYNSQRGFIPNATIIMSKNDIDNIQMEAGIDLLNKGKAVEFCKELFLMNFVVIDTDAQTIKILTPDLHKDFSINTLASVNKQLAMIDSSAVSSREIFKMLKN